jgi:two-component system sensor histidine kinase KdpD
MRTRRDQWLGYSAAVAATLVASALSAVGTRYLSLADVVILYLIGVVIVAMRFGLGPSIIASLGGVAAFDFLTLPPKFEFSLAEVGHAVTLLGMIFVSILVSGLTERLRREQARAEHAHVEAEVERVHAALLSSISHDLRTPLATISASSQLLSHSHEQLAPAVLGEMLADIASEAERLDGLLRNLLAITRVEVGKLRLLVLPTSIDEAVSTTLRRIEHRVKERVIAIDVERGLPLVELDARLFEQALLNVFDNALRYSPPGTRIEITARAQNELVVLRIRDHGVGIAESELETVFEKFRRGSNAPRSDGGVGLGLTICRAILVAHEGSIALSSAPGGGTVVTLSLPAAHLTLDRVNQQLPDIE